jgi:hypothetical protein
MPDQLPARRERRAREPASRPNDRHDLERPDCNDDNGLAHAEARPLPSMRELEARLISSDTRDLARFLHNQIRMTDDEIAKAANVRSQTVRRWRSTAATNTPRNTERLDDLRAVVALLLQAGVLYPEEISRWLRARNSDLGYARPNVLIGQGKFDIVRRAAEHHVARLEGRVLPPDGSSTLETELEQLFATTVDESDDKRRKRAHHTDAEPRAGHP